MTNPTDPRRQPPELNPGSDDELPRPRPLWVSVVAVIAILALVASGVAVALSYLAEVLG
ncbi:MAG TPA: hypothetical protein VK063_12045 [Beutenbergiaceae bacterium]|nr:hypothetical protein [Beutenbergiaceae bacterium]